MQTHNEAEPIYRVSEYNPRQFYISIDNAIGNLSYVGSQEIPIDATTLLKGKNWIRTRAEAEALIDRLINPSAIRIGGE